jgi:hypothetical protein
MNNQHFNRFEEQLERLIESAFAHLFSKTVRAQDIALQLARAMEGEAGTTHSGDPRPVAPDHYTIFLHPQTCAQIIERQPALAQILGKHMIELATNSGYRLEHLPEIEIIADDTLTASGLRVTARHGSPLHDTSTAVMQRADLPLPGSPPDKPTNPHLIINGEQYVPLVEAVINIGRSRDNHLVLDDAYISRHHIQLRLRFGHYTLFDIQSQTGTFVNEARVQQHQLQSGDVIRLGKTRLLYMEEDQTGDTQPWQEDT